MNLKIAILALASLILLVPWVARAATCHTTCYDIGGGMQSCSTTCH